MLQFDHGLVALTLPFSSRLRCNAVGVVCAPRSGESRQVSQGRHGRCARRASKPTVFLQGASPAFPAGTSSHLPGPAHLVLEIGDLGEHCPPTPSAALPAPVAPSSSSPSQDLTSLPHSPRTPPCLPAFPHLLQAAGTLPCEPSFTHTTTALRRGCRLSSWSPPVLPTSQSDSRLLWTGTP